MLDVGPAGRALFIAWLFLPALILLLGMALLDRRPAIRFRRFWCSTAGQAVEVTFVADEVRACSAFEPAGAVTCERACEHTAATTLTLH